MINSGNNITNYGTITSSGRLSMKAVGDIINNAGATISSVRNMQLIAGSGNFVNSGNITAKTGNVTFN